MEKLSCKTGLKKNTLPKTVFEREITLCRQLYKKQKGCCWGTCKRCGVPMLLYKLHEGIIADKKSDINMLMEKYVIGKRVLVFGTFDILHKGHQNLFRQAKKHGNYLGVVVARDAKVLKAKGRAPLYGERERIAAISKSGLADEVILGNMKDRYKVVRDFKPDVICLGYDQKQSVESLNEKLCEMGLESKVIRLKPFHPEKYKSSILREKLKR